MKSTGLRVDCRGGRSSRPPLWREAARGAVSLREIDRASGRFPRGSPAPLTSVNGNQAILDRTIWFPVPILWGASSRRGGEEVLVPIRREATARPSSFLPLGIDGQPAEVPPRAFPGPYRARQAQRRAREGRRRRESAERRSGTAERSAENAGRSAENAGRSAENAGRSAENAERRRENGEPRPEKAGRSPRDAERDPEMREQRPTEPESARSPLPGLSGSPLVTGLDGTAVWWQLPASLWER